MEIGSIISGTLKPDEIAKALIDVLEYEDDDAAEAIRAEYNLENPEDAVMAHETALEILSDFLPPFCYIGTLEGDPAHMGVWVDDQEICDSEESGELVRVKAGEEWPPLDEVAEYVLEVTDHGNATLYTVYPRKEVWAIV